MKGWFASCVGSGSDHALSAEAYLDLHSAVVGLAAEKAFTMDTEVLNKSKRVAVTPSRCIFVDRIPIILLFEIVGLCRFVSVCCFALLCFALCEL